MAFSYKCTNTLCNQDFPVQDGSSTVMCPYCSTLYYMDTMTDDPQNSAFGNNLPNVPSGFNPNSVDQSLSKTNDQAYPGPFTSQYTGQSAIDKSPVPIITETGTRSEYPPSAPSMDVPQSNMAMHPKNPVQDFSGSADIPFSGQNPYAVPQSIVPNLVTGLNPQYDLQLGTESSPNSSPVQVGESSKESGRMGFLVSKKGHFYKLKEGKNTLGRKGTDFILEDPSVSRRHCVIEVELGRDNRIYYHVSDAGRWDGKPSTNGVFLSTRSMRLTVEERIPVYPGVSIKIGNVELFLENE